MQGLRENLIKNAVEFLSDPRVAKATQDKKIQFLKSKGITDEEITEAFKRVETSSPNLNSNNNNFNQQTVPQVPPVRSVAVYQPPTLSPVIAQLPWKSLVLVVVLCSGLGSFFIYLIKKYIFPIIWKGDSKEKKLENDISALIKKVEIQHSEMDSALSLIKTFLHNQNSDVEKQSYYEQFKSTQEQAQLAALRKGINDVKGMLGIETVEKVTLPKPQIYSQPIPKKKYF